MRQILLSALMLSVAGFIKAQPLEQIITDRPDQTESSFTVPPGFLQIETGMVYESDTKNYTLLIEPPVVAKKKERTLYLPSVLIRYGLTGSIELRFGGGLTKQRDAAFTVEPVVAGFKMKLIDEKKFVPQTAFIFHVNVPYNKNHTDYPSPDFILTFSNTLSRKLSLGYNIGFLWELSRSNTVTKFLYTLAAGYSVSPKVSIFAEPFGYFILDGESTHMINSGITYLISENVQIDFSAGAGLSYVAPDWFIGSGLSLRLPR
jgi:hypothetical protein